MSSQTGIAWRGREGVGHECGLHLIVNFAEEANKALKSAKSAILEGRNPFAFDSSESGTFRLLRTACKAFEEHGSDEVYPRTLTCSSRERMRK